MSEFPEVLKVQKSILCGLLGPGDMTPKEILRSYFRLLYCVMQKI